MITAEYIKPQAPDLMVVNSARVSFNKQTDAITDKDVRLINYLARENHFTPFTHSRFSMLMNRHQLAECLMDAEPEDIAGAVWCTDQHDKNYVLVRHSLAGWARWYKLGWVGTIHVSALTKMAPASCEALGVASTFSEASYIIKNPDEFVPFERLPHFIDVTLRETVPFYVARQRFKHKVAFTENEVSRRYVDDAPVLFDPDIWRKRAADKKQGSSDEPFINGNILGRLADLNEESLVLYNDAIAKGMAPELARGELPMKAMTSYYVTGSLAAFARAYTLRTHDTAQREIQDLAKQWDAIIRPLFPVAWGALTSERKQQQVAV